MCLRLTNRHDKGRKFEYVSYKLYIEMMHRTRVSPISHTNGSSAMLFRTVTVTSNVAAENPIYPSNEHGPQFNNQPTLARTSYFNGSYGTYSHNQNSQ